MEAGVSLFSRHAERMTAEALADTRVVEELWSGEPASTWEAARSLLGEGRNRHDAIHALVLQAR